MEHPYFTSASDLNSLHYSVFVVTCAIQITGNILWWC